MKNNFLKNRQGGAAMLVSVVFFLFISLSIVFGLVSPTVSEFKNTKVNLNSKKSYSLAESGVEDAYYRILKNKPISNSESITLDSNSATTNITSISGGTKQISSVGDVDNYLRKIDLLLKTGSGVIFKYGTQAGQGGIEFSNNAGLYGSLYSNGDIVGSNNAFITGDAFSANSPALNADQSNSTGIPTNNIILGNTTNTQDFAQSFKLSTNGLINKAQFYIKKVGSPSNATIRIVSTTNNKPNKTNITTGTLNANLVTNNYGWIDVIFLENPHMIEDITYWIVIDASVNANNYYVIGGNSDYAIGKSMTGQYGNTIWNDSSPVGLDGYFNIFLGGTTGTISGIKIGENGQGNAFAHTLTSNTIAGTAYCQNGSGNNKSCNTSLPDPVQQNMPISDANIEEWKNDALGGGVINGDYSISGSQTIGPKKIIGNLTVSGTLTLSNTIWVTGNINITGKVKLDQSFLATTGIIITDGYINIGNNTTFEDSGTTGSYIMLLSTSSCDSKVIGNPCGTYDAITASNNSNLVIVNAQKGAIKFENNAGVKEMAGNRIYLSNNAYITYGSGIMNVDFTSGPSGGWSVDTWKETQ